MKLQQMICVVALLLICSVSYGQNTQPQTVNTAQSGAVKKTEADTKNMAGYNEWSNNTELGLFFTYGYAIPHEILFNDHNRNQSTNMIGLTFNVVTPLSMCKYVALFHSFSNKFYGNFIGGSNLDDARSSSAKLVYWDLSYTFGVRGYLGTRMVFIDAGIQAALLFAGSYGYKYTGGSMEYYTFGFHGVVGLGFDYPIQPDMSVQGAMHYVFQIADNHHTTLKGFIFDLGLNWKI